MTEPLEKMDADLLDLLDAERGRPGPPDVVQARIIARVQRSLPGGGGGGGGAGPGTSLGGAGLGKSLAIAAATFAAGALVGAAATRGLASEKIVYVERPTANLAIASIERGSAPGVPVGATAQATAPGPSSRAEPVALAASAVAASPPATTRVPLAAPLASAATAASTRDVGLAAERATVEIARTALARGEAATALREIAKHEATFPDGRLAEEREALAVQALVALGRRDEAAARAQRFDRRFPSSMLGPVVQGALK